MQSWLLLRCYNALMGMSALQWNTDADEQRSGTAWDDVLGDISGNVCCRFGMMMIIMSILVLWPVDPLNEHW